MAVNDYFNPAGLMPDHSPTDVLSGLAWGNRFMESQQQMPLQRLMAEISAKGAQEEFEQGAPVRAARRLSDIASSNATASTIGRSREAETGAAELKLSNDRATAPSDVALKIAQNQMNKGKAGLDEVRNGLQFSMIAGQMMKSGGPLATQQLQQLGTRMGIDPNIVESAMHNPTQTMKLLQQVDMTLQNQMTQDNNKGRLEKDKDMAVQGLRNQGSKEVAQIMADSRVDVAGMKPPSLPDLQRRWGALNAQIQSGHGTPEMVAEANQIAQMMIAQKTAGVQQTQGMPGAVTNGAIQTPPPVQAPQLSLPGQENKPTYNVGQTVQIEGHAVTIVARNPDGSYRIKTKDGREGTYKP